MSLGTAFHRAYEISNYIIRTTKNTKLSWRLETDCHPSWFPWLPNKNVQLSRFFGEFWGGQWVISFMVPEIGKLATWPWNLPIQFRPCVDPLTNYPLVMTNIAIENHHFEWENSLYMASFHSYVKLEGGIQRVECSIKMWPVQLLGLLYITKNQIIWWQLQVQLKKIYTP